MVKQQPTDFKAMTVAAIKKYLQERGVSVNGYLKSGLVEIAVAVEKMMLFYPLIQTLKQQVTLIHGSKGCIFMKFKLMTLFL